MASHRASTLAVLAALIAVSCTLAVCAWTADDARIAYRAVGQLRHAGQLVWNPGERVQVFTSPLWVVVLAAVNHVVRPVEVAGWLASALAVLGSLGLAWQATRDAGLAGRAALPLVALASPTLVEHGISGLETPLVALFTLAACVAAEDADPFRSARRVVFFTALAATTRLDSVVLLTPLAVMVASRAQQLDRSRALAVVFQGSLPLLAWLLFATVWFGTPMPNTALAKLSTGIPLSWYLSQGAAYLRLSVQADPALALVVGVGLGGALLRRRTTEQVLALGVGLHLLYLLRVGGDFMVGRFLTQPGWVCLVLAVRGLGTSGGSPGVAGLAAIATLSSLAGLRSPLAPEPCVRPAFDRSASRGIADERGAFACGTSPWVCEDGMCFSRPAAASQLMAAEEAGMAGWPLQARLSPMVYDTWALADPIRARLPSRTAAIGHFERSVPEGWDEVVMGDPSAIRDPRLRELAEQVHKASRGSLASTERLAAMWSLMWQDLPFTGRLDRDVLTWPSHTIEGVSVCGREQVLDSETFADDPVADWELLGVTPDCGVLARLDPAQDVVAVDLVVEGEARWEVRLVRDGVSHTVADFQGSAEAPTRHRVALDDSKADGVVVIAHDARSDTIWPRLGPVLAVHTLAPSRPDAHAAAADPRALMP